MNEARPLSYAFPPTLKRDLKKGEYAVYQLIDVYYKDGKFCGRTQGINNKDIVYDSEGNLIPIGFVEGYNPDGTPRFGNIWFGIETECTIICLPGAKHASLFNFLEVSNYNESNPNRDTNITPMYRRVDSANQSKNTRSYRNMKMSAYNLAKSMGEEEILNFIKLYSKETGVRIVASPDGKIDWDSIYDSIERYAETNPEKFMKFTETASTRSVEGLSELIAWAKDRKAIGFDRESKSWYTEDGKSFLTVKSVRDGVPDTELARFLGEKGNKVFLKLSKLKDNE